MGDDSKLPATVYHYCGVDGFHKIMEGRQVRLSSVRYMNDRSEQEHLLDKARSLLEEYERGANTSYILPLLKNFNRPQISPFAFCLSEEGDSLSQWRAYADAGAGFAIGFSSDCLRELANKHTVAVTRVVPIQYEDSKQMELLRSCVDGYLGSATALGRADTEAQLRALVGIWCLSAACKNRGFREEKEVRVVALPLRDQFGGGSDMPEYLRISGLHFRVASGRIVPCFTLPFPPESVTVVCLGPTNDARDDDFYLRAFLENSGYERERIKIISAEATLRSSR